MDFYPFLGLIACGHVQPLHCFDFCIAAHCHSLAAVYSLVYITAAGDDLASTGVRGRAKY